VHHTASPAKSTSGAQFQGDASYCAVGHQDAPVGNFVLGPEGQVSVHAAGAANTQGKGGPWTTSRGVVPLDGGNSRLIACEASNDGQGQPWTQAGVYAAIAAAIAGAYGFRVDRWDAHAADILSHEEWTEPSCPGRKCDPAGPSPWSPSSTGGCSAGNLWVMDAFRADLGTLPAPTPPEDDMPAPAPMLIQATGADGSLPGAVYATDGRFTAIRWVPDEWALQDAQYWIRYAGLSDAITPVDRIYAYGELVGPTPTPETAAAAAEQAAGEYPGSP
jgi:hypothetical protein